MFPPASSSARSNDSSDSGIYDLDDDYSFVITENSPPELVQRVVADFTPVENLGDDQGLLGRSPAGRGEGGGMGLLCGSVGMVTQERGLISAVITCIK